MTHPHPPTDRALAKAADMRAGGASWEAVAVALRRSVAAVERWPALDPGRWQQALRDAERRLLADAAAESVLVLRRLLRSDDEKVQQNAARLLLNFRLDHAKATPAPPAPTSPPATSEAQQLVAFLEAHTDDHLARLAADRHLLALPPGPVADGGAGEGGQA